MGACAHLGLCPFRIRFQRGNYCACENLSHQSAKGEKEYKERSRCSGERGGPLKGSHFLYLKANSWAPTWTLESLAGEEAELAALRPRPGGNMCSTYTLPGPIGGPAGKG